MINTDDYFTLTADDEVGVMINNLGGTSNLELAVMANDTIRYLGMLTVFVTLHEKNWAHVLKFSHIFGFQNEITLVQKI